VITLVRWEPEGALDLPPAIVDEVKKSAPVLYLGPTYQTAIQELECAQLVSFEKENKRIGVSTKLRCLNKQPPHRCSRCSPRWLTETNGRFKIANMVKDAEQGGLIGQIQRL